MTICRRANLKKQESNSLNAHIHKPSNKILAAHRCSFRNKVIIAGGQLMILTIIHELGNDTR